ncbi:MAG: 2-C-methyl-D-erythritol 2,4-cyclodiphosphate synthase [Deltaproteobacteria bacterium]|nr:2-C-methyl-D-erythritol 2,4-cyclodiphosphate synthase [Deltaproteobacteria bacterium]
MRVGMGYDVHRLVKGRPLVLGGVAIPFSMGLLGHSDADVLLHAVCDALLGAAGLGDIGRHFPDSDEAFRGIASTELLASTVALLAENGYRVGNVDATLIAEAPKIAPFREAMRKNMAEILGISADKVNVKATTTEELGFVGRGEGAWR